MAERTLYLFDGYNVLHAAGIEDRRELVDMLASYVALRGARGVVVFDGVGADERHGTLEVRYAPHADAVLERLAAEHRDREHGRLSVRYAADADALLERLAAEHRDREHVILVSSDEAVRGTSGLKVAKVNSREFASDLAAVEHREESASRVGDRVDEETRARLERLRRGPVE